MNTDNLHDILDETVQVYSQKKQSRSETPAEIGTHFHPLLDRLCETAEAQNASDILISKGFPPSLKINSALTPQPQKALTGEETAAIAASTMNAEQSEIFRHDGEINYSVQSRSGTRYRANAYHSQGSAGLVLRRINHVIPQMRELGLPEKTQRPRRRTARAADYRRAYRFGQIHHDGDYARTPQQNPARPYRYHRRPD